MQPIPVIGAWLGSHNVANGIPFDRFDEMMRVYGDGFGMRNLDFAVWGHISDRNVHPNVSPRSYRDVQHGNEAILEFGREVARLGGCPLAEHGVGRNLVKQGLLRGLYGDEVLRRCCPEAGARSGLENSRPG
jgi:D-lactate dehydrogenase (cytochrome)